MFSYKKTSAAKMSEFDFGIENPETENRQEIELFRDTWNLRTTTTRENKEGRERDNPNSSELLEYSPEMIPQMNSPGLIGNSLSGKTTNPNSKQKTSESSELRFSDYFNNLMEERKTTQNEKKTRKITKKFKFVYEEQQNQQNNDCKSEVNAIHANSQFKNRLVHSHSVPQDSNADQQLKTRLTDHHPYKNQTNQENRTLITKIGFYDLKLTNNAVLRTPETDSMEIKPIISRVEQVGFEQDGQRMFQETHLEHTNTRESTHSNRKTSEINQKSRKTGQNNSKESYTEIHSERFKLSQTGQVVRFEDSNSNRSEETRPVFTTAQFPSNKNSTGMLVQQRNFFDLRINQIAPNIFQESTNKFSLVEQIESQRKISKTVLNENKPSRSIKKVINAQQIVDHVMPVSERDRPLAENSTKEIEKNTTGKSNPQFPISKKKHIDWKRSKSPSERVMVHQIPSKSNFKRVASVRKLENTKQNLFVRKSIKKNEVIGSTSSIPNILKETIKHRVIEFHLGNAKQSYKMLENFPKDRPHEQSADLIRVILRFLGLNRSQLKPGFCLIDLNRDSFTVSLARDYAKQLTFSVIPATHLEQSEIEFMVDKSKLKRLQKTQGTCQTANTRRFANWFFRKEKSAIFGKICEEFRAR